MGVETSLRVHNFVYTVQPVPIVGRVDLAAVFLDAVKFKQEQLYFSKLFIYLCEIRLVVDVSFLFAVICCIC